MKNKAVKEWPSSLCPALPSNQTGGGLDSSLPNPPHPLTIALVTDDFLPAGTGVGVHVQKIAAELVRRGHKILLITTRRPGQPAVEIWNGAKVYRLFSLPLFGFYQALPSRAAIRRIFLENAVDVVHFHYLSFLMLRALKIARALPIRIIYTAHMTIDHLTQPFFLKPLRSLLEGRYRRLCAQVDSIICVSSEQTRQTEQMNTKASVRYMSNPIDFDGSEAPKAKRSDRFVVFFAGRLDPEKNVGYLLKAFRRLVDRRPNAELWIAGKGFQENKLRHTSKSLGLAGKVFFLGHVPHAELPKLYAAANVFVLPSLVETQGMVALEAMRFRLPVIVTNRIVSARELVSDGVNGYIVNPESVQELADTLSALHDSPERCRQMGEAGFALIPVETTQTVGAKLERLYQDMIRPRPPIAAVPTLCAVCGAKDHPIEWNRVRCNVRRFRDRTFGVWRCGHCLSINSEKVLNLADYYQDYPLRKATLNFFTRVWYGIFLKRLVRAGLKKNQSILDYGCGIGLFLDFLTERGYTHCVGFDPYVEKFKDPSVLKQKYDWVLGMDVIEHNENPRTFIAQMAKLLIPGGRLCLETPNADGISLSDPEEYIHSLHAPYHVNILSQKGLLDLCRAYHLNPVFATSRYFVDSWQPGTSWSFIQSLARCSGNDVDSWFETPLASLFIKHPSLLIKFFFGVLAFPKKKDQMMVIFALSQRPKDFPMEHATSIPDELRRRAQDHPLDTACWRQINGIWKSISWKEYWCRVEELKSVLDRYGLKPGNRLVIVLPTSMEWELLDKAALCLGLVVVGLEPHMDWDTMATAIKETHPAAIFTKSRELALKILGSLGDAPKILVCHEKCETPSAPLLDWNAFIRPSDQALPARETDPVLPSSPAALFFTSGTTGAPKGIVYSHAQLLCAAQAILSAMGPFCGNDRTLAWLPMATPFQRNMNLAALLSGVPIYFWEDPKRIMEALPQVRPTVFIGVPRVFEKIRLGFIEQLKRHPLKVVLKTVLDMAMACAPKSSRERETLSWAHRVLLAMARRLFAPVSKSLGGQIRFMVTGSAPCQRDVLLFFHMLSIPLFEAYGTSECAVPLSMNRPDDFKIGTVGRPLRGINLQLEEGEIEVSNPGVFNGYENQPTQTTLTSGRYLSTGDIGRIDDEGYLTLIGRKDDQIKTSTGHKVAPMLLEQRLTKVLGAEQAMVVGRTRPCLVALACFDGPKTLGQVESLRRDLQQMNDTLSPHEQVRGLLILPRLFSMDQGELTRNLKLRRSEIERKHSSVLDALYNTRRQTAQQIKEIPDGWLVIIPPLFKKGHAAEQRPPGAFPALTALQRFWELIGAKINKTNTVP